jgi:small subunit ribosomal protein S17
MMAEDETKKEAVEETPQDEAPQDAGPDAAEGGSDAALGSSPDAPEEESAEQEGRGTDAASASDPPSTTPPASEESSDDGDAPAPEEEKAAEPEPAAEEEKAAEPAAKEEPDPADDLPWKERRRLERSRRPHEAKPAQTPEERKAARLAERKRRGGERRKERAAKKAKKTAGTGTPVAEKDANAAKVRQGIVVSDKGQKSITVRVDIVRRHPTYEKVIRRSHTLHAHDERNEAGEGDTVRVVETRPLSKTKRWRLVEIMEKAK